MLRVPYLVTDVSGPMVDGSDQDSKAVLEVISFSSKNDGGLHGSVVTRIGVLSGPLPGTEVRVNDIWYI